MTDSHALLEVTRLPAFSDNYLWLIHAPKDRSSVIAVDPGDASVILKALQSDQLRLAGIFTTHHHADHVGGLAELLAQHSVPVYGPRHDPIPQISHRLDDQDTVALPELGLHFMVHHVPGHTRGHIAYFGHGALFCGDTLFSGGCGRLFEGTPSQMLSSLDRLSACPPQTLVYCAHEYTASNLRFARVVDPTNLALESYQSVVNQRLSEGLATIPTLMAIEQSINPFLRSRDAQVRAHVAAHLTAQADAQIPESDAEHFAALREWKNEFKG